VRDRLEGRICWLFFTLAFLIILLCGRLAYLQLYHGRQLTIGAVAERTLRLPLGNFFRGDLLDCYGRSLLDTGSEYAVGVFPTLTSPSEQLNKLVNRLIEALPERLRIDAVRNEVSVNLRRGFPVLLPQTLSADEALELKKACLNGVYLAPVARRYGPDSLARHLIGSVQGLLLKGEVQHGVKGLEALYDKALRPADSGLDLQTVVNRLGQILPGLGIRLSGPAGEIPKGNDLQLTIDRDLQSLVEKTMDRYQVRGAVVAEDVSSGEIRALASRPQYDQNTGDGDQFDRSLALYHPGSTFKIVVAAAALSEGKVTPEEKFYCPGQYTFPDGQQVACWEKGGHGSLTFSQAFANSCNVVFVQVALRLGSQKIESYAHLLGADAGMADNQLPGWQGGVIKVGSFAGQIGNAALGQDSVQMTPVNVASLAATVAHGGIYIQPSLIRGVRQPDGLARYNPKPKARRVLAQNVAAELQRMMRLTVTEGTGQRAAVPGMMIGGKTGSAETANHDAGGLPVSDAWFTGYTSGPGSLAITVFVESGGTGGDLPARIFHDLAAGWKR
jgi:penicillin-binding protein 2